MRLTLRLAIATVMVGSFAIADGLTPQSDAMCGYFRPIIVDLQRPSEMLQPSQIAFITWDPDNKIETVTVQPRFEGNALDFGMVIPTPSQPKLHEMPRDFFKALGTLTMPKRRAFPESKLMPVMMPMMGGMGGMPMAAPQRAGGPPNAAPEHLKTTVEVVEVGQVGSLDYKILAAGRADDLHKWLKDNKYSFAGDEATLNFYVQKKYFFTVMKIDTLQMKRNKDGSFVGDVTPTRFTFTSEKLVYPLKITQVSVKDTTDALFYVQAPSKMDLEGDMSYQYQWVSMLQHARGAMGDQELTDTNRKWMGKIDGTIPTLMKRGEALSFNFQFGAVPRPNKEGRLPSTLEWAKRVTANDIKILAGDAPFSETVPDPDDGFTAADMRNPQRAIAIQKIIQHRLAKANQSQPRGYLVRDAKKEDLKSLTILKGHVQPDQYLTKFRRVFTRGEMNDDLVLVASKVGEVADVSEHEEVLRMQVFGGGRFGRPGFDLPRVAPLPPNQ